ncbi:MAG TPA: cation:proton antiporter [Gemmatimonadales bacterium]|jgi:CPA1 family monovalent cation:H+ antiporter
MLDTSDAPAVGNVIILLIVIATAVALAARRLRVPYTVSLVIVGVGLGATHLLAVPHLTRPLVFAVFLPGLVFEAAYHLDFALVRQDRAAVLALAIPGVAAVLSLTAALMVGTSRALHLIGGFGWQPALVLGAVLAATDPIAVVALFRSLGAPRRLATLIEAESLLNDGTAIVFFGLILTAITGHGASPIELTLVFLRVVGLGVGIGFVIGLVACQVTRHIDDPMIEITLTVIAAYGSFALADQLGGSGVLATVVAGLLCANYGAAIGMSPATRAAVMSFWEYVAFLLNSIVFLLIGFEVRLDAVRSAAVLVAVAFVAGLVARTIVVSGVVAMLAPTREPIPRRWIGVLTWGGVRGALSMVLAVSLADDFPGRVLVITTTFGVVALSILVQGLTLSPMLRRAGLLVQSPPGRG